jgi:DNA-binding response OmpR family regulator
MIPAPYILIIDDDWMNREMLEAHLEGEGHTVKLAANGQKGLALAEAERPALVLLDLRMPEMDGVEVLQALRQIDSMHNIPVLMITGLGNTVDVERSLAAGADDFLAKPFETRLMLQRVKTMLRITRLQDELTQLRNT